MARRIGVFLLRLAPALALAELVLIRFGLWAVGALALLAQARAVAWRRWRESRAQPN